MNQAFALSDFTLYIQQNYPLIYKVNEDLANLRSFTETEIHDLCQELRLFITEQVALHGGHLASNLGVVELTVALLRNFDFTKDRLIWDVGHQCYAWKILTYRASAFAHLREKDGLAGFPKPDESIYDHFATGHATTSISAALGMAMALQAKGAKNKVIAVIGDGALTGGMAWEALNNISELVPNLLIILNDNAMSIDKNVGFVAHELSKLRLNSRYLQFKLKLKERLNSCGALGQTVLRIGQTSKAKLRSRLGKTREFFCERYGCRYYGPLDGHDLQNLEMSLQALRSFNKPALLHILTEKGHGYAPASADPVAFHGVQAHDKRLLSEETEPLIYAQTSDKLTYTQAFSEIVLELAKKTSFVCITAAMASGTGLREFSLRYPKRFFDVGIAEQHAVCFAAGLVSQGMKTICAIYDTFLQRALDAVIHDVCLQNLPLILAVDRAGLVGEDGATHQGIYSLAFLLSLPNLKLINVSDPYMLQSFLIQAVQGKLAYPLAIRYPKGTADLPDFLLKENLVNYELNKTYANCYDFQKLNNGASDFAEQDWRKLTRFSDFQAYLYECNYGLANYTFTTEVSSSKVAHAQLMRDANVGLTLLTSGRLLANSLQAILDLIAKSEINVPVRVIDCYDYSLTIQELQNENSQVCKSIQASRNLLILEESSGPSSLFASLNNCFTADKLKRVVVKNLANALIEQGKVDEQLADYGLDKAGIQRSVLGILNTECRGEA